MSGGSYMARRNRPLQIYAALFLIVLYVPVLFIPLFSFNNSIYARFPLEGFTTQWFVDLWNREPVWNALWNSVKVGLTVSILSTALGVVAARAITRYRLPGKGALVTFIMLPLVVPGIIFGVALLVLMSRLGVPLSLYTVTLGHIIVCLPFAVATLLPRFEGFDASMEEASADLGENGWWTFWRVTFPIVFPGILASLLLTFTISFDEFRRVHHGLLPVGHRPDASDVHLGPAPLPAGVPLGPRHGDADPRGLGPARRGRALDRRDARRR